MFPGVSTAADTNRTYPLGQTGVQMLGYVGQISPQQLQAQPVTGLRARRPLRSEWAREPSTSRALRGHPGIDKVEVDRARTGSGQPGETRPAGRRPRDQHRRRVSSRRSSRPSTPRSRRSGANPPEGAAVALDPQTGAVLALVSSPTYDPTWWTNGISTAHYRQIQRRVRQNNDAIQGLYTPGSTFKLATATAALQTGLISTGLHLQRHRFVHHPRVRDGRVGMCDLSRQRG